MMDGCFCGNCNIKSIYIPDSVTVIGGCPFDYSWNLTVNCQADTEPDGWFELWSEGVANVNWGVNQ